VDVYAFRSTAFARNGVSAVCLGRREEIEGILGIGIVSDIFLGMPFTVTGAASNILAFGASETPPGCGACCVRAVPR